LLRKVLAADEDEIKYIRGARGVGADAVDLEGRPYELKVYAGDARVREEAVGEGAAAEARTSSSTHCGMPSPSGSAAVASARKVSRWCWTSE
jgi:hypothetical protein